MTDLPGGDLDVNTTAGFNAALAELAGVEVPEGALEALAGTDTDVSSGLTTVEESTGEKPRDERGRFAPAAPKPEGDDQGAAPAAEEREGEEGQQLDPELSALLERHGGDPVAALRAAQEEAKNAQSVIGRQGNELGEARRAQQELAERIARLEGRLEATPQQPTAPIQSEQLANLVVERGGRQAVVDLIQAGYDDATVERAFATWAEYDDTPYEALAARQDWRMALASHESQQGQQGAQPQEDPTLAEIKRERQLGSAIASVRSGMEAGEWAAIKDHLIPAFEDPQTAEIIKKAVVSDDQQTQLQGMSALVQIARGRAIAAATAQANAERSTQLKQGKQAAQVATGSLRPVQQRQPETPQNREERVKAFHEALLRTETTSVFDGLTYAGQ